MIVGLLAALGSAGCYGLASILQASATDRAREHGTGSTGLTGLVQLVSRWRYLCGLGLDAAGFLAAFAALRTLPLFVVQAAIAGSVAVTAVAAHFILGAKLHRSDWGSLGVVMGGLVLLGAAGRPEEAAHLGPPGPLLILLTAGVVAAGAAVLTSMSDPPGGVLALLAGGSFAGVGVSARALEIPHSLGETIGEPLLYALGIYGVLGIVVFAAALQRSSVITVTTITLAVQTVIPATLGIAFLGDQTRRGFAVVAVIGFVLTVLGSIRLARSA